MIGLEPAGYPDETGTRIILEAMPVPSRGYRTRIHSTPVSGIPTGIRRNPHRNTAHSTTTARSSRTGAPGHSVFQLLFTTATNQSVYRYVNRCGTSLSRPGYTNSPVSKSGPAHIPQEPAENHEQMKAERECAETKRNIFEHLSGPKRGPQARVHNRLVTPLTRLEEEGWSPFCYQLSNSAGWRLFVAGSP